MFADYHVHSAFSDDSEYEMDAIAADALKAGMTEICFTDHVDYGIKRDWDDQSGMLYRPGGPVEPEMMPLANVDYPRYYSRICELRDAYQGKIRIKMGMEFGMQRHTIPEYEALFQKYPFDFIILSIHQIDNKEFWTGDFQRGYSRNEYYRKYYEEMLYLTEHYQDYSVLGHMDLISRYDPVGDMPFAQIESIVEQILKKVIRDGKGIEVNTSCYRYGLDMTPGRQILQMYHELGGDILTIGSDSHKPEHLGYGILEIMKELKKIGFTKICTYQHMKPQFHDI